MSLRHIIDTYRKSHWGIEPDKVLEVHDPDLPDYLSMMGRLVELVLSDPASGRELVLAFEDRDGGGTPAAMLLFDRPKRTPERLFIVLDAEHRAAMKRKLWKAGEGSVDVVTLTELAHWPTKKGGERGLVQHKRPYANVRVRPVGIVESVTYSTAKLDDAEPKKRGAKRADEFHPDHYEHHLGEDSGHKPWLGVDATGRLWWAGGAYRVEDRGICD